MVNEETILVRIINKVEGADEIVKNGKIVKEFVNDTGELTRVFEKQTGTERRRVTVQKKTLATGEDQVKVNKETLAQGPPFQAHFLGLMFGGMALNRAMSNLTATSMEWVGIGELMSTTMGVVMLPATLELLDKAVLPLMEALLGLPEDTKLAIGVTVFGLQGLGKVLETLGQIALFKIAFPGAMASMTNALKGVFGKTLLFGIGLVVTIESFKLLKEGIEEGDIMKEVGGIVGLALGLAAAGFALGIPAAAVFPLAIGIALFIDWKIAENRFTDKAKELNIPDEIIGEQAIRSTALGSILFSGKEPSSNFLQKKRIVDFALGDISAEDLTGFAVGGNVTNTGIHFLHEGETVLRKDQVNNQNGSISVTYNVNVSDKREFEQMLRVNNQQLVRDVRRDSRI